MASILMSFLSYPNGSSSSSPIPSIPYSVKQINVMMGIVHLYFCQYSTTSRTWERDKGELRGVPAHFINQTEWQDAAVEREDLLLVNLLTHGNGRQSIDSPVSKHKNIPPPPRRAGSLNGFHLSISIDDRVQLSIQHRRLRRVESAFMRTLFHSIINQ